MERTAELLSVLQSFPLEDKIQMTQDRIIEFVEKMEEQGHGAYVSFSGGKDSMVLLDIARTIYPDIPAVFSNTGLEYPEIQKFAKSFDNVDVVTPKMRFDQVISAYGYPLIGKDVASCIYLSRKIGGGSFRRVRLMGKGERRADGKESMFNLKKWLPLACDLPIPISNYCCQAMKKRPMNAYKSRTHRYQITGTMAEESLLRRQAWLRTGCNAFEGKIQSKPMSFWTEQDVLQYIVEHKIEICSVYGDIVAVDEAGNEYDARNLLIPGCKLKCTGCRRTGCIYCGFGFHLEKGETRFQRLAKTHPRQYEYCMSGGQWVDNPAYDPVAPEYEGEWKNWNPKKIWVPSKKGLGLKTVFDMVNEIYGKEFYRYV